MPTFRGRTGEFYSVVNEAIADFLEHGFDSQARLDKWLDLIARAARMALIPQAQLVKVLQDTLGQAYQRTVSDARLMKVHEGISRFTIAQVKPELRAELQRRILASANLITLNRDASIARTLQRFAGWASSVPPGGTAVADRRAIKKTVRKGIAGLPFEERRVIIDQSMKLVAAVNDIIATDGGAIAGQWHHIRSFPGYTPRPEHVARDGKYFLLRGSWAHKDGLVKPDRSNGFIDDVERVGELPYCSCSMRFVYALQDLPREMLTSKGKESLLEAKSKLRRLESVNG
jgi:hypothetical protein